MGNTKLVSLSLLSMLFLLASCKKESSDSAGGSTPAQGTYYLNVKIDGVEFTTNEFVSVSELPDETDYFTIAAVDDVNFGFTLDSPIALGIFEPMAGSQTTLHYQELETFAIWGANEDFGSGTITITENTPDYLRGTFSFTGYNPADMTSKEFTEGSFKAQKL